MRPLLLGRQGETLGGGSGGGTVLRLLGVLKAQKRVDGDLIDLAQLDELWKLRLRRAPFTYLKILVFQSIFPINL